MHGQWRSGRRYKEAGRRRSGLGGRAMAEEGRSAARWALELQELQERLRCAREPVEIIKTLKVLQGLDLSLDILVETGIDETVNSFKEHATAGNVAKSLLKEWKKLISPESKRPKWHPSKSFLILHYLKFCQASQNPLSCVLQTLQMFIKETDHLWKKHCQRDFKNESLLEYESWREMYWSLFNQREEKLKILTKNILSAQSEKPKGRQVKLAYVSGAAKPARNICRQQEIHGPAGSVIQLHPTEKCKTGILEMRDRNNTLSNLLPAGNSISSSSGVMIQNGKKPTKKIAPIMKKTLKSLRSWTMIK